jgi:dipeptidyl aminopeptidase/acylaminoacyl peptidase
MVAAPSAHATFPGANGKIALTVWDGNDNEIHAINPDGTGDTPLTNNSADDNGPAWSADGKKILFNSNRTGVGAIWVMNADGTGQTQVTFPTVGDDSAPGWSPDGAKITFHRTVPYGYGGNTNICRSRLYVANADGSGATDISPPNPLNCFYAPDWSPDGALIAFVATVSTPSGNNDEDVWTIKPDGTSAVQLSHHPYGTFPDCVETANPAWAPDAGKIMFQADCDPGAGQYRLISINRDGTGQQIVGEPRLVSAAWSPDGQKIAYTNVDLNEIRVANSNFANPVSIRSGGYPGTWQPIPNRPPDCSGVAASRPVLTTANHRLVPMALDGATDPDGDPVTLSVDGVTQDEPVVGSGDNTSPDAVNQGDGQLRVRAERNPHGDGRVYRIAFTASDGRGGSCSDTATVSVPRKKRKPAVDSAPPSYDSFAR